MSYTPQDFEKAYKQLCQKYGFVIKPDLGFKSQLDGTYTIAARLVVFKLQRQEVANAKQQDKKGDVEVVPESGNQQPKS